MNIPTWSYIHYELVFMLHMIHPNIITVFPKIQPTAATAAAAETAAAAAAAAAPKLPARRCFQGHQLSGDLLSGELTKHNYGNHHVQKGNRLKMVIFS